MTDWRSTCVSLSPDDVSHVTHSGPFRCHRRGNRACSLPACLLFFLSVVRKRERGIRTGSGIKEMLGCVLGVCGCVCAGRGWYVFGCVCAGRGWYVCVGSV